MQDDGVEVRPLYQITGEAEFNEVFFDDAVAPRTEIARRRRRRLARVAMTTLMNERVCDRRHDPAEGVGDDLRTHQGLEEPDEGLKDPARLDAVMSLWSRAEVARLTNIRASQNRKMGDPGPEGSIGKMASADLNKEIYELVMDLMGAEGMLYGSYEMVRPETAMGSDTTQKAFLRVARQLHRGWHLRGHAQHLGRARPRPTG